MNENSLIRTLQDTIESQNKTIEGIREELKKANENMEYLIKKLHGRKTEKTSAIDGQLVISDIELGLFNEAEKEMDSSVLEPVPFEEPIKRTRKGYKRKNLFKDLPNQDQVFKLETSQQVCPIDGNRLSVVGNKFIRSEIKYIPAEISVVNIYQSRGTLSNWIIETSEEWLNPVVEKLLKDKYLHADETPVQVLNEEDTKNTTKSYMWIYSTSVNAKRGIRIFKYAPGRSGDNAKEFLKGFKGYLHTDGFSGYGKVKDIHHCLCWAHVRRYFTDALPKDMKSPETTLPATGIAYCNQLFDWERKFKDLSPEDRKKQRLEKEKPVLEAFWSWAESAIEKVLPKSNIGKALQYALNHKEKLETYLEDGNCVISNNIAENSIKPFTVGRKNWQFCGSPEGAKASACVYSLVETAKANGLNPYKYLEFLLSRLPGSNFQTNPKILELMMPLDELIQRTCKVE